MDSSCLVALAFGEDAAGRVSAELLSYDEVVASPLLEAEIRSAMLREGIAREPKLLEDIGWVIPDQPLSAELRRVFAHGYVRGADAWHLATALWMTSTPDELPFLTLDRRQSEVAASLGFPTPMVT